MGEVPHEIPSVAEAARNRGAWATLPSVLAMALDEVKAARKAFETLPDGAKGAEILAPP